MDEVILCSVCRTLKSYDDFHKNKNTKTGHTTTCKPCAISRARQWALDHPERWPKRRLQILEYQKRNKEKYKENTRRWRQKNRDHYLWLFRGYAHKRRSIVKQAGTPPTLEEWVKYCAELGNKCLACGATDKKLTVDHIVPLIHGGQNDISNLQPLCLNCNDSKRDRTIDYRTKSNSITPATGVANT